jgi:hypothetical protein
MTRKALGDRMCQLLQLPLDSIGDAVAIVISSGILMPTVGRSGGQRPVRGRSVALRDCGCP